MWMWRWWGVWLWWGVCVEGLRPPKEIQGRDSIPSSCGLGHEFLMLMCVCHLP